MRTALAVALAGFLGACGGGDAPPPGDSEVEAAGSPTDSVEFETSVRKMGLVVVGPNFTEFAPCGEGPELLLDGPLALDILDLHAAMTPGVEPFEAMFIDVVADVGPPPATGSGYPASLIVHELRRAAYEGWDCADTRADTHFEASGTEPFWTLAMTESATTFTTPDAGARPVELGELRMVPEGWAFSGSDGIRSIEVLLEDGGCHNAMSGAYSHLVATVTLGEQTLVGCGWFGEALDPQTR